MIGYICVCIIEMQLQHKGRYKSVSSSPNIFPGMVTLYEVSVVHMHHCKLIVVISETLNICFKRSKTCSFEPLCRNIIKTCRRVGAVLWTWSNFLMKFKNSYRPSGQMLVRVWITAKTRGEILLFQESGPRKVCNDHDFNYSLVIHILLLFSSLLDNFNT